MSHLQLSYLYITLLKLNLQRILAMNKLSRFTKLNLGSGANVIDGWANIDLLSNKKVISLDLTKPLPIRSQKIKFIYSEHFIEHISFVQAKALLGECYRVLQYGGVIRVSTPSLRKLIDAYLSGNCSEWNDVGFNPSSPCQMMNDGMRLWGHQFVYDAEELKYLLEEIGFHSVTNVPWRESKYEELKGLEVRPFHDEIIVEAIK